MKRILAATPPLVLVVAAAAGRCSPTPSRTWSPSPAGVRRRRSRSSRPTAAASRRRSPCASGPRSPTPRRATSRAGRRRPRLTATATPCSSGPAACCPPTRTGAFPVEFTAPDTPGVLLTFPAIQVCENGEELAWISGDPADQYPAPRVLVLAAGLRAGGDASTTCPLDAPGRDQLVAVVDVDNPNETCRRQRHRPPSRRPRRPRWPPPSPCRPTDRHDVGRRNDRARACSEWLGSATTAGDATTATAAARPVRSRSGGRRRGAGGGAALVARRRST